MENKSNPMKITIKGVFDIIFRNKMIIIITFTLCMIFTLIGIQFVTPIYDANVKMLIRGQNVIASEAYEAISARGIHLTQAEIVRSHPVLKRAVIALNLHNRPFDYEKNYCSVLKKYYIDLQVKRIEKELKYLPSEKIEEIKLEAAIEDLRDRLTVRLLPGTDIFVINITAFTSEEAIETANVISRSYTMFDQIQQLAEIRIRYGEAHPTVIQLVDNITEATNNLSGKALPDIQAIGTASVKIIEQATSNYLPVSMPKRVILSVAFLVSISISFGIAIIYGFFDRTIKSPQDIVEHLDIPYIGSIPEKHKKENYIITDDSPNTKYYNFYEELSEQLLVFLKTQGLKTAAIGSPSSNNNHKYIIPNIGYFLSQIYGYKILLVDVNFSNPNFQQVYSIKDEKGIDENVAIGAFQDFVYKFEMGPDVMPARKSSAKPLTILRNANFDDFIKNIKNQYDAIFIDATSIDNMKEVSFISEYSDATVLIIDEGKLRRDMLKNSLSRLLSNNTIILGAVLNNRTFPIPEFIYKKFKYFIG